MTDIVSLEVREGVGIIWLDNPPVNALSQTLRSKIDIALDKIAADKAIGSAVIASKLNVFVAGADITEFGKPAKPPVLVDLIEKIRHFKKPVVAAINGVAFGGGAEIALSCSKRIAGPKAQIGLPEINLGLIPGAGALQLLPPIIGADKTFELAKSGKPLSTKAALSSGIISLIAEGDLVGEAIKLANTLVAEHYENRVDDTAFVSRDSKQAFDALVQKELTKRSENPGIAALIDTMQAGFRENFSDNLKRTRDHFSCLQNDDRSKAMRYAFLPNALLRKSI